MSLKFITAEEAASYIENDENVGFGGFTAAGTPKVVSVAIAKKAEKEHAAGRPFKIATMLMECYREQKLLKQERLINQQKTLVQLLIIMKSTILIYIYPIWLKI